MYQTSTQDHPFVSIILPVYNVEKYLGECFATIISQTYENIEVILVDDGSTDGSGEIADKLAESDPRATIIHKKNGGLSDARNAGMKIAKGEYITFIDSDDFVEKRFVEDLLDLAVKTGADIVQCENSRKQSRLGKGSNKVVKVSGRDAFIDLMKFKTVSPTAWGKIYRLSLFRDNGIEFPFGRLHEDTAVLYKLVYYAGKVISLDKTLYYYRINSSGIMSSSYTKNHYSSVMEYSEELDEFMNLNGDGISKSIICRHKALRLLSVLNKLALYEMERSLDYRNIRKAYVRLSVNSHSVVCLFGVILVHIPSVFRSARTITPPIRKLLGKV